MRVAIDDLASTVLLLLVYVALNPLIQKSLEVLLPQLTGTEALIARAIPLIILVVIALNPLQDEAQVVRR